MLELELVFFEITLYVLFSFVCLHYFLFREESTELIKDIVKTIIKFFIIVFTISFLF